MIQQYEEKHVARCKRGGGCNYLGLQSFLPFSIFES